MKRVDLIDLLFVIITVLYVAVSIAAYCGRMVRGW
jgi:hypothetical protein